MPLLSNKWLWMVLLFSTNIFTGLFVFINLKDLGTSLCSPGYNDNQLILGYTGKNERLLVQDRTTASPSVIQKRNIFRRNLTNTMKELGIFDRSAKTALIPINCSIASTECKVANIKTTINYNVNSSSVCWTIWDATIDKKCQHIESSSISNQIKSEKIIKSIFAITPTYARYTQKVDLTSLCHTIMWVENLVWIVVEDSDHKTSLVSNLLERCKVTSVHLNVRTPPSYRPRPGADRYKEMYSRGVKQRNLGLSWIREHCSALKNCTGTVYFMDDDNKYDLRLFEEIKKTKIVSVFPVGFSGGLKVEGPTCDETGRAVSWHAEWDSDRRFPIDMAGFAVCVETLLSKPNVWVGFDLSGEPTQRGYLETSFIENFATRETVECRGKNREVLVWHVKTQKPWILFEANNPTSDNYEV